VRALGRARAMKGRSRGRAKRRARRARGAGPSGGSRSRARRRRCRSRSRGGARRLRAYESERQQAEKQLDQRKEVRKRGRTRLIVRGAAVRLRLHLEWLVGPHLRALLLLRVLVRLALCPTRLDADDPHTAEEDERSESEHPALERREDVELAEVDEARRDRRAVVRAEGEWADEGWADEAQGAVQVGELRTSGRECERALRPPLVDSAREGERKAERTCMSSHTTRTAMMTHASRCPNWFSRDVMVEMRRSMPVLVMRRQTPDSVPDVAPYATAIQTRVLLQREGERQYRVGVRARARESETHLSARASTASTLSPLASSSSSRLPSANTPLSLPPSTPANLARRLDVLRRPSPPSGSPRSSVVASGSDSCSASSSASSRSGSRSSRLERATAAGGAPRTGTGRSWCVGRDHLRALLALPRARRSGVVGVPGGRTPARRRARRHSARWAAVRTRARTRARRTTQVTKAGRRYSSMSSGRVWVCSGTTAGAR